MTKVLVVSEVPLCASVVSMKRNFFRMRSSNQTMQTNEALLSIVTAIFAGMALCWLGHQHDPTTSATIAVPRRIETRKPVASPIVALTEGPSIYPSHNQPGRNIFSYFAEAPARRSSYKSATVPASTTPQQAVQMTMPRVTPAASPPEFEYRFLGTFGPIAEQFAVFEKHGDVLNVRAGEPIDQSFTLRRIGIESVEVVHASAPSEVRRVALAQ